jgi:hypothetical protein
MTHIVCRALACIYWEQGVCGAEEIEYEPDTGCITFQDMGDLELEKEDDEDFDWEEDDDLFKGDGDNWDEDEDEDDWDDDEL